MAVGTMVSLGLYFLVMLGIGWYGYKEADTSVEGLSLIHI